LRLRDAIIDKTEGWLSCGPVVVAALAGARLTTVDSLFAANGSMGPRPTPPIRRWRCRISESG
jgi:hypothetical protein